MSHVLTIGTFDGVHAGHRALVRRAREIAGSAPHGRVTALVFDPHPASVLRPGAAPGRLSTYSTRRRLILEAGADNVVRLEPTPDLLGRSAADFIDSLVATYRPTAVVEGPDFRFGRGREGDVHLLQQLGAERGFTTHILPAVDVPLTDLTLVTASSSIVRWLLTEGRVRDAALVLERPYELEGIVRQGDRRGRTIGFPTANLATDFLLPADAIYACRATVDDGRTFAAGVHIGPRDTFGDPLRVVEAHLINPGNEAERIAGLPEYGWKIRLAFIAWLRDPVRFESVQALVEQMRRDCDRAARLVEEDKTIAARAAAAGARP